MARIEVKRTGKKAKRQRNEDKTTQQGTIDQRPRRAKAPQVVFIVAHLRVWHFTYANDWLSRLFAIGNLTPPQQPTRQQLQYSLGGSVCSSDAGMHMSSIPLPCKSNLAQSGTASVLHTGTRYCTGNRKVCCVKRCCILSVATTASGCWRLYRATHVLDQS